jgi:hypothetical protein
MSRWLSHHAKLHDYRVGTLGKHSEWIVLDYLDTLIKLYEDKDGNLTTQERGEMLFEAGSLRRELMLMSVSRENRHGSVRQVFEKLAWVEDHIFSQTPMFGTTLSPPANP